MSESNFLDNLKAFGLTGQEAGIYFSLLKNGAMSGYEVAKETGISRSNVYSSLASLVDKGAAYIIDGDTTKYTPVEVNIFSKNVIRELEEKACYLSKEAPSRKEETHGYITITGSKHIRNKIREMLESCELRLYIMAESSVISEFDSDLKKLIDKGYKIVILTDEYNADKAMVYKTVPDKGQIRFITDSSYVLTGTLTDSESDTCLYSSEPNLVSVMKEALKNKISLISMEA